MSGEFVFGIVDVTKSDRVWFDRLGELDDGEVMSFVRATDDVHNWVGAWSIPGEDESVFCQRIVERLVDAVRTCYQYDDHREMGWFVDGGRTFAVTGGMSWGDSPTECLDDMWMFGNFQSWYNERKDN
jgi:hypothetical protein